MIMQAFEIGVTKDIDAINYAGVSKDWYYDELKKNPEFAKQVEAAKTKRKMHALAVIRKAALTNWSAAGWFLERTYQEEFAIKNRHEITGPGGGPIATLQLRVPELSPEKMKKLAGMVVPEANGSNGNNHDTVEGTGL
jgi:hypothetical protein